MVTVLQALFWQFALAMAEQAGRRPAKITVGSTLSVWASPFLCQYGLNMDSSAGGRVYSRAKMK